MGKISKIVIQQNGVSDEYILDSCTVDTVIDNSEKIIVDNQEVDNPEYGKSIRQIINDRFEDINTILENVLYTK